MRDEYLCYKCFESYSSRAAHDRHRALVHAPEEWKVNFEEQVKRDIDASAIRNARDDLLRLYEEMK